MPARPKCPRCGSFETMRSHRSFAERIMIIVRPYRCDFCNHRFIVLSSQNKIKRTIKSNPE